VGSNSVVVIVTRYGWTVRGSNPVGNEIFRTHPDRCWGPPNIRYNGYRNLFPRRKRPGRFVKHLRPSRDEVKERVELYLYSPFRSSWPITGWHLYNNNSRGMVATVCLRMCVCVCLKPIPLYEFCYTLKPIFQKNLLIFGRYQHFLLSDRRSSVLPEQHVLSSFNLRMQPFEKRLRDLSDQAIKPRMHRLW
jgi:hypothetical protein